MSARGEGWNNAVVTSIRGPFAVLVAATLALGSCANDAGSDSAESSSTELAGADGATRLGVVAPDPRWLTGPTVDLWSADEEPPAAVRVDGASHEVTVMARRAMGLTERRTVLRVSELGSGAHEIEPLDGAGDPLHIVVHDPDEPLFAGPRAPILACSTAAYGLAASSPPDCRADMELHWDALLTDGSRTTLPSRDSALPDNVQRLEGGVPALVRVETAVINRGVATIQVLDPKRSADPYDATDWNRRVVYEFGGGCGAGYTQGTDLMGGVSSELLLDGYLVARNTMTTFQTTCNDVISAETALRMREHITTVYGVPDFVIGSGGSGGAIQQYLITQNYPGILDAVGASLPFPDAVSIAGGVLDCTLLNRFTARDPQRWDEAKRVAVYGHLTTGTCGFWERTFAQNIDPHAACFLNLTGAAAGGLDGVKAGTGTIGPDDAYDAASNPRGVRCTLQDSAVNIFGRDPTTGFAPRPTDNVGVQYGLGALNSEAISVDEFLDLNEGIGGFDIDGQWQPERMQASAAVVRRAYETGRVIDGSGDLRSIPVVTVNVYTDPTGDIHDRFRAFSVRERLSVDGVVPDSAPLWTVEIPRGDGLIQTLAGAVDVGPRLVRVLDEWLTTSQRPSDAGDQCVVDGTTISGDDIYNEPGPCRDRFPVKGDPRTVSGQGIRNDIIKCATKPVEEARGDGTYDVSFTAEQATRLAAVFADGVCDYSQPGVGQVPVKGTWLSYGS